MAPTRTTRSNTETAALAARAALESLLKKYKLRAPRILDRPRYLVCKVHSGKFGRGFLKMSKQRGANLLLRNQIAFDRRAGALLRASGSQVQLPRVFSSGSHNGYRFLISEDVGSSLLFRDPDQAIKTSKNMSSNDCLLLAIAHSEFLQLPAISLPLDVTIQSTSRGNRDWVEGMIKLLKDKKVIIKGSIEKIARRGPRHVTLFPRYGDLLPWHVCRGKNAKLILIDSEMASSVSIKWADVAWCSAALSIHGAQLKAAESFVKLLRELLPQRLRSSFDLTARHAFAQRCLYGLFEAYIANPSQKRKRAAIAFADAVIAGRFCRFDK